MLSTTPALVRGLFAPDTVRKQVSEVFVRGLGLVYAAAFASLFPQIAGLVGPEGILPFDAYLDRALALDGWRAVVKLPTLFWLTSSGAALRTAAAVGAALGLLVATGRGPRRAMLGLLFVLYLSLYHAGQVFTSFQWDYLLLESGALAVLLGNAPPRLVVFLLQLLLFRLRFESGLFKLLSGDPSWRDFSALSHYFETQPLPHVGAWYAQQLPESLLRAGVGFTFVAELAVPCFIFLPRPFKAAAAAITVLAQLLILATSNHNFINLLTILLCLFLVDDRMLARWVRTGRPAALRLPDLHPVPVPFVAALSVCVVALGAASAWSAIVPGRAPRAVAALASMAPTVGVGNVFHLFPTMQTQRQELRIFGSADGITWEEYEFRYKPGAPDRAPAFIVPHQPRLDWMMWFLPPQSPRTGFWLEPLLAALRENRPAVTQLFARNPFAGRAPPAQVRVLAYRYRFTSAAARVATGNWWQVELLGEYPDVPPRRP